MNANALKPVVLSSVNAVTSFVTLNALQHAVAKAAPKMWVFPENASRKEKLVRITAIVGVTLVTVVAASIVSNAVTGQIDNIWKVNDQIPS